MSDVALHCGDCLEVMRTLPDGCVDAVITDPPFGIDFGYGEYDDDPELYESFMKAFVSEAQRLVGNGPVFVWQAMPNCDKWHRWFPSGFRLFAACKSFVQYRPTPVQYSWDPIVFWGKPKVEPSVYSKDYHEQRLAPFGAHRKRVDHPCPRPFEQVQYIVELVTVPGMIVIDPFLGSGTTGIACVKTGRNFIGIELVPTYFAIAQRRIEQAQMQLPLLEFAG